MVTIFCTRCGADKEQLEQPPLGGKLGEAVMGTICQECWAEWREVSSRIINHYGFNLGNPDHRQQLREAMKEFLNLTGA